jgi:hypothetical protein
VDMVTDEMRALQLPVELQDRTIAYYEYLWNRHHSHSYARRSCDGGMDARVLPSPATAACNQVMNQTPSAAAAI